MPTKYHTDPMVVFHHVNAYEEDGCLLFDVIAYEDGSLYQLFYLANLNEDFKENSRLTVELSAQNFFRMVLVLGRRRLGHADLARAQLPREGRAQGTIPESVSRPTLLPLPTTPPKGHVG